MPANSKGYIIVLFVLYLGTLIMGEPEANGAPEDNGDPAPAPRGSDAFSRFHVNPPQCLSLSDKPQEEWNMFKQQFKIYQKLTELDKKDKSYQSALFLHCVGPKGLRIYNGLTFSETEDKDDLPTMISKFDAYIIGETNETYERYKFNKRNQEGGEKFDSYVSELK